MDPQTIFKLAKAAKTIKKYAEGGHKGKSECMEQIYNVLFDFILMEIEGKTPDSDKEWDLWAKKYASKLNKLF
jgi:hypothetical protein